MSAPGVPLTRSQWPVALCLAGLALLACANARPTEFTLDSLPIIAEHPLLGAGSPWWLLFAKSYWGDYSTGGLYRPATMLTYWIERRVVGVTSPGAHAAVNAVLHVVAVLLLWRLALRWTRCWTASLVGAALFAVHPVLSEVVPNLVGRADLLAAIGVLVALLAWERVIAAGGPRAASDESKRRLVGWLVVAVVAWCFGLLAKESAVVFPAIAFIREWWRRRERTPRASFSHTAAGVAREQWMIYAGLSLIVAAWWSVHVIVSRQAPPYWQSELANPLVAVGVAERAMTAAVVLARYLGVIFVPVCMAADHSAMDVRIVQNPADFAMIFAAAALAGYAAITVLLWLRAAGRPAAMGLTFAALAILPVSNLAFPIGTIMAERLLYLPLAGVSVAAGVAGSALWGRARERGVFATAGVALMMLAIAVSLVAQTWQRNAVWHTTATLWSATARDAPNNHKPWQALANLAWADGDTGGAARMIERSLELAEPVALSYRAELLIDAAAIHNARAREVASQGGPEANAEAARHRERALQLAEEGVRAYRETEPRRSMQAALAAYYQRRGETADVVEGVVRLYRSAAEAAYGLGRWDRAAAAVRAALALRPGDAELVAALDRVRARAAEAGEPVAAPAE